MEENIIKVLQGIFYPETGRNIIEEDIAAVERTDAGYQVVLRFKRARDPFAASLKKKVGKGLEASGLSGVTVTIENSKPDSNVPKSVISTVGKTIAVASGKGGVGKSTVTANLALTLHSMGYRVGIFDADIYGPSQPKIFGVEEARPVADTVDGTDVIVPVVSHGIKIISIGFFVDQSSAVIWRGPMVAGALKQLTEQTAWGELDYLLVDFPPGTGDVQITMMQNMKIDGALIVSTPQDIALADVIRGINMFREENVNIPVLGLVANMAWFTPAELPDKKYYIFGKSGAAAMSVKEDIEMLAELPLYLPAGDQNIEQHIVIEDSHEARLQYGQLADRIVNKLKTT